MPPKKANGEKKTRSSSSSGVGGKKKGPSPYNRMCAILDSYYLMALTNVLRRTPQVYMKSKLAEFKEKYPDMAHKDRFKKVAEEWKVSPENPSNQTKDD
ncbi:hypothetical protein FRB94_008707 [Tulasnella sp. JGI-2019a]|nr:hypothetical protein FRB94_008707 [Tulasnella sp. JGI-2019a]